MTTDVDGYHSELAARFGVKLPRRNAPRNTANQARFLRSIGLTWGGLTERTGERRGEFFALNPTASSREWAGCALEGLAYMGFERPAKSKAAA